MDGVVRSNGKIFGPIFKKILKSQRFLARNCNLGSEIIYFFLVSAEQRDRIRRRQRVEMEKQMKEIADQAGASKDQFDEAMKLAKTVLEKKDDSNVESAVAAVAAANQNAEQEGSSGQADQIEEELD